MKPIPIRVQRVPASAAPAAAMRRDVCGAPWRWSWLLAAPHRLGFFAGAVMLSASSLWWLAVLAARVLPALALPWQVSPSLAHALLMNFSFMPLFFIGFLFTAGPKWLGRPEVAAHTLLPGVMASLAGWGVFLMGVHGAAPLAAIGLGAVAWGWTGFSRRFWQLLRASDAADRTHARVVAVACSMGVASMWAAVAGLALEQPGLVYGALALGLWWFLAPVYAAVLHRMIPFFTANAVPVLDAWRPKWLLWSWLVLLAVQVPLSFGVAAGAGAAPVEFAINAAAGALLIWLALRWGLVQSLKIRLLAMLHLGFVWLGLAFVLQAMSIALVWLTGGGFDLGLAPLHAVTMGFLGSTLIAMATRVSCGHGGRTLAADDFVWVLFWCVQLAVVLRLVAAFWLGPSMMLLVTAAALWAGAMLAWSWRYVGWFGRPRADGRPG